jgi:hypothetical protein
MIWSLKKHLVGPRIAHDMINPKIFELKAAKQILAELFDIKTNEVDAMIQARMEDRELYGQEFA